MCYVKIIQMIKPVFDQIGLGNQKNERIVVAAPLRKYVVICRRLRPNSCGTTAEQIEN